MPSVRSSTSFSLAGPPFRGETVLDTLVMVRSQPPVPPTRLQPKVPRDLETIVLKCLEKDPLGRYLTAETLADDLGRFLEGRPIRARRIGPHEVAWRWCKRHRPWPLTLLMFVLTMRAGVAGITWQWSVARAERTRAEANLGRVVEGLDRWYAQLSNISELQHGDFAPLRRKFLEAALVEFERLNEEFGSNPRFRKERILATGRASQVYWELGQKERSVELIRSAIDEAEQFFDEEPTLFDRQETLYRALHRGIIQDTDHERVNLVYAPRAATLLELLLRAAPPEKRAYYRERQILNVYNRALGKLDTGDKEEAIELFHRSIELAEALLSEGEKIRNVMRGLGASYSRLCFLEVEKGQEKEAEAHLRRSNGVFRGLLDEEPQSLEALLEYCISCEQLDNYFSERGRMEEATEFAEEVCRVLEKAGLRPRPGYEILAIRQRLVQGYHMLMTQHRDNYIAMSKSNPTGTANELSKMEAACQKSFALADALAEILSNDGDLDYWNAASRLNLHIILIERGRRARKRGCW